MRKLIVTLLSIGLLGSLTIFNDFLSFKIITVISMVMLLSFKRHRSSVFHVDNNVFVCYFVSFFFGIVPILIYDIGRLDIAIMQSLYTYVFPISILFFLKVSLDFEDVEVLYKTSLIVFAVSVVFFVIQSLGVDLFSSMRSNLEAEVRGDYELILSIFGHAAKFSLLCEFVLIMSLSVFLVSKRKIYKWLSVVSLIFVLLMLRRKSIIAIVIAGTLLIYISAIDKKVFYNKSLKLVSFALLIIFCFVDEITFLVHDMLERYVLIEGVYGGPRVQLHRTSFDIVTDNFPFGEGLSKFGSWMSRINYSDTYYKYDIDGLWGLSEFNHTYLTDTFWPMIFGELGIFGGIFYLLATCSFFYKLFKFRKKYNEMTQELKVLYLSSIGFYCIIFIGSLISPMFSKTPHALILSFLISSFYYRCSNECFNGK